MVKHTEKIRRQQPTNCLSVFDRFVGLALKVENFARFTGNTSVGVSFLIKLQTCDTTFSCEFCEIFRTPVFIEHLRWLILSISALHLSFSQFTRWSFTMNHSHSTYAKSSEKQSFLDPLYVHLSVRIRT